MKLHYTMISVFTKQSAGLKGNISAVIKCEKNQLSKDEMQGIANDLNQPATTFLVKTDREDTFRVLWFAPDGEIGLCGHGSVAAAAFLFEENNTIANYYLKKDEQTIVLHDFEGNSCGMEIDKIKIDKEIPVPDVVQKALGVEVLKYHKTSNKDMVLVKDEESLRKMKVNFDLLRTSSVFGYTVTAQSTKADFVSRTIVPHVQQLEDHATGSSHAILFPYWSEKLKKQELEAIQLSPRGGYLKGHIKNSKSILIKGDFKIIAQGEYFLSN